MKTLEQYKSEQPKIETMSDMSFTEETLVNRIPTTAFLKLLSKVNHTMQFTDGFSIRAIAEMDEALCLVAKRYKVLVSIGWSGDGDLARWNPQTHYIFTFENKNGKVVNVDFDVYGGEFTSKGYLSFLQEFSEYKVYLT